MNRFTSRDYKLFAAVWALDALVAAVVAVWALVDALTSGPASSWWWVALGVALTSATTAGALRCRSRASQVQSGGAA